MFLVILTATFVSVINAEEVSCLLNCRKPLHSVSDKFISFVVDPAILMSGLNLSGNSMALAKHLTPAYVKMDGPSIPHLRFSFDEHQMLTSAESSPEELASLTVTTSMWESINGWFKETGLSPIYAVSPAKVGTKWNFKEVFSLLEATEKLNVKCSWFLNYGDRKSLDAYRDDLETLNYMISIFQNKSGSSRIVGGLSHSLSPIEFESDKTLIRSIQNVTEAIMWESTTQEERFPKSDVTLKLLWSLPKLKVWTTAPRSAGPITLSSGILWAKQLGEAAKMGYDVVFRSPRLYELLAETPVYWVTVLHKALTGRTVLEVKPNLPRHVSTTFVYAHCARNQNSFSTRGAITLMVLNNSSKEEAVCVKSWSPVHVRSIEVQSYVLTAQDVDSTDIFLNDVEVTLENFVANTATLTPRLRWVTVTKHLRLDVPPRSISFFVLPDARVPACINVEVETSKLKQIDDTHVATSSSENTLGITSRRRASPGTSLNEIYRSMQLELDEDDRFYERNRHGNVRFSTGNSMDDEREGIELEHGDVNMERRGMRRGAGDVNSTKRYRDVKIGEVLEANLSEINKRREEIKQNFVRQLKFYKKTLDDAHGEAVENTPSNELENIMLKMIRELINRKKLYSHFEEQQNDGVEDSIQKPSLPKRSIGKGIYKRESAIENGFDEENNFKSRFEANGTSQQKEDFQEVSIGNGTKKKLGEETPSTASKEQLNHNESPDNDEEVTGHGSSQLHTTPEHLKFQVESRHRLNTSPQFERAEDDTKQVPVRRQFPKESKRITPINMNNLNEETSQNASVGVKKISGHEENEDYDIAQDSNTAVSKECYYWYDETEVTSPMADLTDDNCDCDRTRRDTASNHYTEEDIRYYRKLMNGNIRRMREIMLKQKMSENHRTTERSQITKANRPFQRGSVAKHEASLKSALQQVRTKLGRRSRETLETVKNLKTTLEQRLHDVHDDETGGEMKGLVRGIKNKLKKRMTRSLGEVYIPKVAPTEPKNFYVPLDVDKFFEENKKTDFKTKKPTHFEVIYGDVKEIPFIAKRNKEKRHVDHINEIKTHEGNRLRADLLAYDDEEDNRSVDNEVEEEHEFIKKGKKSEILDETYKDLMVSSLEEQRRGSESDVEQSKIVNRLPSLFKFFNKDRGEIVSKQETSVTPRDASNVTIPALGLTCPLHTTEVSKFDPDNKEDTKTRSEETENISKPNTRPRKETADEQNRSSERKNTEDSAGGVDDEGRFSKVKDFAKRISGENVAVKSSEERRKLPEKKREYVVVEEVTGEVQTHVTGSKDEDRSVEGTCEPDTIQNEVVSEEERLIANSVTPVLHLADPTTEGTKLIHEGRSVLDTISTTLADYISSVWGILRALI